MKAQIAEHDYFSSEQLYLNNDDEELERSAERAQRWISILVLASSLVLALITLVRLV
jgi:hypothetical protein